MTDFIDNKTDTNNSFSYSSLSSNDCDIIPKYISTLDKLDAKNYPIRCPLCSGISILNADFKKNYFCTICDNQHKNEYNSFESFIKETNKDLNSILCHECKKSNEEINLYRCGENECNLFFCDECKENHKHDEKNESQNFIEIDKIDIYCPIHKEKYKYYNIEKNNHLCEICFNNLGDTKNIIKIEQALKHRDKFNITEEYNKISENVIICKNIQKIFNSWLNTLINKAKNFVETLNNYCILQQSILRFLETEEANNNNGLLNNNINVLMNYESFHKNKNIDIYFQKINNLINNCNIKNFEKMSYNYIQILNDEINFNINSQKIKDDTINENKNIFEEEEKKINLDEPPKKKKIPKLDEMQKLRIELQSDVKCFSSFNKDKNIIIGLNTGEIDVYEFYGDSNFKFKLKINEFQRDIKFICELDTDIFAATDGKNIIKIIELKNNMKEYKLIQTIQLKEDSDVIYSMINLPNLSNKKKKHYFCTGDEKHILIWKSNKQPKNLKQKKENHEEIEENSIPQPEPANEDNEPLCFTLDKDIKLKSMVRCLVEVNENYIAAAFYEEETVNFYNIQNDFKKESGVKYIPCSGGSNILSVLPKKNVLIVGCKDGFRLIHTKKLRTIKQVICKYSVTSIESLNKKNIICCCSDKKGNKIKIYRIDETSLEFKKASEKNVHDNEIWDLKTINNKIYFTNNCSQINYLI